MRIFSHPFPWVVVPAAGLAVLLAGCQPPQTAPLDLRAPIAAETAPEAGSIEVENSVAVAETENVTAAPAPGTMPENAASTETAAPAAAMVQEVVVVTDTAPLPETASSAEIVSLAAATPAPEMLAPVVTPLPEVVPPPAPPPQLDPATLIGSPGDRLLLQLGEPDYQRIEAHVRIWQYRLDHCVVNFVLVDAGSGEMINAWTGRHRELGLVYDHEICIRELGERDRL